LGDPHYVVAELGRDVCPLLITTGAYGFAPD
jgi:hypothetical protein